MSFIGPIPEGFTQYEVYRFVAHPNRWTKIGIAWPTKEAAITFMNGYSKTNSVSLRLFAIVEKVTTYEVITMNADEASTKPHTGSAEEV